MKKVSIILFDWSVRESFHAIDYLNRQTIPRKNYEIIWIEYYNRRPEPLQEHVNRGNIDKWIVLNKTGRYFKHLMCNEGIVASTGEIVVIPDSDAIFSPTFIESIVNTFDKNENIVLYLEEVRTRNKRFYPFRYIPWESIWKTVRANSDNINWDSVAKKPVGLTTEYDLIHYRNYGACFCARRKSIIEAGGFDEHPSYHCFLCGPHELGFRLVNKGYRELWHQSEWILHVWHPWVRRGVDIMGESDGRAVNSLSLETRKTRRLFPLVENEKIRELRVGGKSNVTTRTQVKEINIHPDKLIEKKSARFRNNLHGFKSLVKYLLSPAKIDKVLIVMKRDYDEKLFITKFGDFISRIKFFDFEMLCHKLGQQEMSELLVKKCKRFKPDLVIFVPLDNTDNISVMQTVEPAKDAINRIVNKLGVKVYVHIPDSTKCARHDEWLPHVNYVGTLDSLSAFDKYAHNPKVIHGYPAVNLIYFYDKNTERDIDVCFWGSIPVNSRREEYIDFLRDNGINVCTRLHRVSVEKYAEILNRSRISLSLGCDGDGRLRKRAFEIMACKSLLLENGTSGTKRLFDVDKDFLTFRNKQELLEKVKYYFQHEEERKLIAQSGYDKVTNVYNARNMWGDVLINMGFHNKKSFGNTWKIIYFSSWFLKWVTQKVLIRFWVWYGSVIVPSTTSMRPALIRIIGKAKNSNLQV